MKKIIFSIADLVCCGKGQVVEQKLKVNPHIVDAIVDMGKKEVMVVFHANHLSEARIKQIMAGCGFHCSIALPIIEGHKALAVARHKLFYKHHKVKH